MYSDQEVFEELEFVYKFLKKHGEESALIYLRLRMEDYQKKDGDL